MTPLVYSLHAKHPHLHRIGLTAVVPSDCSLLLSATQVLCHFGLGEQQQGARFSSRQGSLRLLGPLQVAEEPGITLLAYKHGLGSWGDRKLAVTASKVIKNY